MEAGEFSSRRRGREQAAEWVLGVKDGVGRAKRSQGRRTEVWDALEQEQCGGSCGLEGVEQRQCKAGTQP